ncbi:MAG TPA: PIN domain-containing protein [Anaerolineales bacterium]|nr:PIN domain-containing protein [Anaerolineales bacterium]
MILCDTNLLIEFYKGNTDVVETFGRIGVSNLAISVITAGELLYGAHDKRELRRLKDHIALMRQLPVDSEISELYLDLLEKYVLAIAWQFRMH